MVREVFNKLPEICRNRIEQLRNNTRSDYRHKELYVSIGRGYLEGLRDCGIITEHERLILQCYLTI